MRIISVKDREIPESIVIDIDDTYNVTALSSVRVQGMVHVRYL